MGHVTDQPQRLPAQTDLAKTLDHRQMAAQIGNTKIVRAGKPTQAIIRMNLRC